MGAEHIDIEEIFNAARQISDPGERAAYLDRACGSDAAMRARVDKLLAALDEVGSFMEIKTLTSPPPCADEPIPPTVTMTSMPLSEKPGTVIGRYKLLQLIGEGGFGSVYMAEQQEPVHRKVALKIIKLGMDTKQVIARFEAERQALAMMDHPNIAKVFDAGATETGRPYFVMELVKGVPITEYCDENNLSTKSRLDLFMLACHAIQHAHQKGIIHRDVKPSNVMVTLHDGTPVPKVIDFGIAKATDHRLTERTLFTEYNQLVGTPLYMSPEQAEMSGLDVDTRTDIYSLGVLLYELLIGTTPFYAEQLRGAAYDEIRRIIREVEPPKPSTRLSTMGDELTDIARHRKVEPKALSRIIRGDLDWIVMKAMEKDRMRRYATPSDLAADIQRYLDHEPVVAGAPGAPYRVRKFVRRNRGLVAGVAAVFVVLVSGIVASTIFAVRESRARFAAMNARAGEAEQRRLAEVERDRALDAEQEARQQSYFANIIAAGAALSANEIATVRRRLDAAPPEFRNWEWRYLNAEVDQGLPVLRGHGRSVTSVAFSPDSARLASASIDGIRLWDTGTGEEIAFLQRENTYSVVFSPDGDRLASAVGVHSATVQLLDASTGALVNVLRGHESLVASVAFSPDGRRLASASWDKTVRLWDVSSGKELQVLRGHQVGVYSVAFSPDGTRLASCSGYHMFGGKTVRLWDVATGRELLVLRGHEKGVASVAFSPDGTRLASAGEDNTVRLWNSSTGEALAVLRGHESWVKSVAFSPDGTQLASGGGDKTVRLWNPSTGAVLNVFQGHEEPVMCVAFSPDGRQLVSASRDGTIRFWEVSSRQEDQILRGHKAGVSSVAFNADGTRLVSGSADVTVRVWDAATGEELCVLREHHGGGVGILLQAFVPEVLAFERLVSSVAFSPDGTRLASASWDNTVRLWDADTGHAMAVLRHDEDVASVVFSPDGSRLASTSIDKTVRVWNASTGAVLLTLKSIRGSTGIHVHGVAFSPDGTYLAAGANDGTVRLWDSRTGEDSGVLRGPAGIMGSLAFSPDGTYLAAGVSGPSGDKTVRVWNVTTRKEHKVLRGHENGVSSVAFSPDSARLASASGDRTVRVWDVSTGEELAVLRGHEHGVASVAFSPDGTCLASASIDKTVRLWHAEPYRARHRERLAIRSAEPEAASIVDGLWQELSDWDSVAQEIRGDRSLDEPVRRAALNLILHRAGQD